jgi:nucleoside-diphosphate-sugar epimerase
MVYGNFQTPSVDEDSPKEPLGMYGTAKLCSELFIRTYHRLVGIPYTIIRPSALYGPRCINNRITQKFVENAILGKNIVIHGDGSQKLDFTFIEDLIDGTIITQVKDEAKNQTFNITTGHAEPLSSLIDILKTYFSDLDIQYTDWDKSRPVRGTLKIDRIKNLGYSPRFKINSGYRKYIDWYLDNKILD